MDVHKCTFTLMLEFNRNPGLTSRLLDQDGFPWQIVSSSEPNRVTIKPLRPDPPTTIREIFPWNERLSASMVSRAYDYIAHLDTVLDWKIEAVAVNPKDTIPLHLYTITDNSVPETFMVITAGGFVWGPLPLSPLEPPAKWPFQAEASTGPPMTLKPCGRQRMEVTLTLKEAILRTDLPWEIAIKFATAVTTEGWERAVALIFPHGARLTYEDPEKHDDSGNRAEIHGSAGSCKPTDRLS
jgi:hypothetical protein